MDFTILTIVGVAVIVVVLTTIWVLSRYRRCPNDQILVVFGKAGSKKQNVDKTKGELGFEPKIFGQVQFLSSMKDNVLEDTLSPKFTENVPKGVINRVVFKYRRWKANSWKRRMCYEGSDAGMFIRSAWAHIVKPAHI